MKKFLAVLMSLVIIFCTLSISVSANDAPFNAEDITEYPLIIVPGYSSTILEDAQTGEQVWYLDNDDILQTVLDNIIELGAGLGALTVGNAELVAATVGREMGVMFEKLRCNPDGTSAYDITRAKVTAEETNTANLKVLYPDGKYTHEPDMAVDFAKYIGAENIFNFTCDFRMGAEYCARQLDELVQDVKLYTKKDKVNLFAVSHGGQVTATYLTLYGYKNDVDNALMTVPAIGGAGIAYDALTSNVVFDEECLLRFIQHGMRWEEDYDWLMKAHALGFIDDVCNALVPHIFDEIGYWGSLWDFIPTDKYESAKKQLLDADKSGLLIEKSDRFHYEILPSMRAKLEECKKNGMNISIIAGTGNPVVTGFRAYSDGIITTASSTGAEVAPLGQRFSNSYVQKNACGGKNKMSPDRTIDASCGYLPDNTWYVNGLFHGMTYWDNYTRDLLMTLLFTDNIKDVYSSPDFPQFKDTTNPSSAVYVEFENCKTGEIDENAVSLKVTNCCWQNEVSLAAVIFDGLDISVKVDPSKKLAPSESVELEFIGDIPEVSEKTVSVTVYYSMNTITPIGYRTQYFNINNGEKADETSEAEIYEPETPFDKLIGEKTELLLKKLGLKELFAMFYNIIWYWINII